MHNSIFHLGLTGYPLGHSYSPILHKTALQLAGFSGTYDLFPIPPLTSTSEGLGGLVNRLKAGYLHGLNVTIPHKQEVLKLSDVNSPVALRVGAANLLVVSEGQVRADNMDVIAFETDLSEKIGGLGYGFKDFHQAFVLGSGGAARAVVDVLIRKGLNIYVGSRNQDKTLALCERFNDLYQGQFLTPIGDELQSIKTLRGSILIVNATPVGMEPAVQSSPWPDGVKFPKNSLVYDLIYNPIETHFMRSAREEGVAAFNGMGMLVRQAALSFQTWTGFLPPIDILQSELLVHLGLSMS